MAWIFTFFALFTLFKIADHWLKTHPAVPDTPASLIDS